MPIYNRDMKPEELINRLEGLIEEIADDPAVSDYAKPLESLIFAIKSDHRLHDPQTQWSVDLDRSIRAVFAGMGYSRENRSRHTG